MSGDEEVDGVEMIFGALGEGVRPAHLAAGSGPQGAKPTFDVVSFSFLFAAATMRVGGEGHPVRFPEVAAGGAPPVVSG